MPDQKVYLVRHAESTMRKRYCGSTDAELSLRGIEQAKSLTRYFDTVPLDMCWTSTQKRAIHTSRLLLGRKKISISRDPDIRELHFGAWERKSYRTIQERWSGSYARWLKSPESSSPPGGEPFGEFRARVFLFSEKLKNALKINAKVRNVLVVAHGGSLSVLAMNLLGLPLSQFWKWMPKNASVTILQKKHGMGCRRFNLVQFNDAVWEN